ncbi:hypothetical protein QAD02_001804 [Eretmocerus hayati]|uniref:Uncharacterized protein n=1 Tax=Eretmocerus hayati TaxID=131215 RepID=A0ACC2NLW8_9HYME|nr:hypothetical protein QAD02_001804 [Eretmocerus hayati]
MEACEEGENVSGASFPLFHGSVDTDPALDLRRDEQGMNDVSNHNSSGFRNCTASSAVIGCQGDEQQMGVSEGSRIGNLADTSSKAIHLDKSSSTHTNYSNSEEEVVKELRNWLVTEKIPLKSGDGLLQILRKKRMPNLPACTKTFLKKESKFQPEPMAACDGSTGEFVYIEMERKLKMIVKPALEKVLELAFGIDGFSPFKSSTCTVWPILSKIDKREYRYRIFTVAVYAGDSKPKSANDFLKKFVEKLNHLLKNGIEIDGVIFKIRIKFFICDNPARAFLKLWIGHASFSACERCFVVGKKVNGVTVFLDTNAQRRTDDSFRNFADPDCHHGVTVLVFLEDLDFIYQFLLDPMHLGPGKRILDYLLGEPKKKKSRKSVKLSSALKLELQRGTEMIVGDIPDEFPRKVRPTSKYQHYKAVEHKFMLQYAAPIVFKKLMGGDLYKHLMLLSMGCRLLSGWNVETHVEKVRGIFLEFVQKAPSLYGQEFESLLVHCLIHICEDVEKYGLNLTELSAFEFESYLGSISRLLRSSTHLVVQYCNRMEETESYCIDTDENDAKAMEILIETKEAIHKIKHNGMILEETTSKSGLLSFSHLDSTSCRRFKKMSDTPSTDYLHHVRVEEDYEYALIRFRHQGPRKTIEAIDVVPTDWFSFNDYDSLQCKYLSSHHLQIKEKVLLLHKLVEQRGLASKDWPDFPLQPIGRAHTYEEALIKLEQLKTKENVLTDCEDGNESEKALITQLKRIISLEQQADLKRKMALDTSGGNCPTTKKLKTNSKTVNENQETLIPTDDHTDVHNSKSDVSSVVSDAPQIESQTNSMSGSETDTSHSHSSGFIDSKNNTNDQDASKSLTGDSLHVSEVQNIPVVDLSMVECKNDFETAVICCLNNVLERLGLLEISVKNLAKQQKESMRQKKLDSAQFCEKYHLELPLKTLNISKEFEKSLTSNGSLRRDLYAEFKSCLGGGLSITKTFGSILRKFMSKDVLLHYTAVKHQKSTCTNETPVDDQSDEDTLFEPLQFCKCMKSQEPPLTSVACYWRKPMLSRVAAKVNYTTMEDLLSSADGTSKHFKGKNRSNEYLKLVLSSKEAQSSEEKCDEDFTEGLLLSAMTFWEDAIFSKLTRQV